MGNTYNLDLLRMSERSWRGNSGLRAVYYVYFRRMLEMAAPGASLELGSGIGVMKEIIPGLRTSDIQVTPYVDFAASAYEIEQTGGIWATIYAMDMLHHLREPLRFLRSASCALKPGGRVILLEPAATFGGRCFYRLFHHEPIQPQRLHAPYVFPADDAQGAFANMGMGWALFQRDRKALSSSLASMNLKVVHCEYLGGISYSLTGGFSRRALASESVIRFVIRCESWLPSWWWRIFGLRMLVVLEKIGEPSAHAS